MLTAGWACSGVTCGVRSFGHFGMDGGAVCCWAAMGSLRCCGGGIAVGTSTCCSAGAIGFAGAWVLGRGFWFSGGTLRGGAGVIGLSWTKAMHSVDSCCWIVSGKNGIVLVVLGFLSRSTSCPNTWCSCSAGVMVGMLMLWWNHVS